VAGAVGARLSHGCVHLDIGRARYYYYYYYYYYYDHLPVGAEVVVF
jgi:hypothetical protein